MKLRLSVIVFALLFGLNSDGVLAQDAAQDHSAKVEHQTATFAMYCYWTGEATLGRVDGVVASRIGHWAGREIVQVDFDPAKTDLSELVQSLRRQRSFDAVVLAEGESAEQAKAVSSAVIQASGSPHFIEPKHSLRTRYPALWALGLDEEQAIALNSWSYFGGPRPDVLTEEQLQALAR